MPYFLQKRGDKTCVMKGTKAKPKGTVKCHNSHDDALRHMRALYVHVEDAAKSKEGGVDKSTVAYKALDGKYQVYKAGDQWLSLIHI